MNTVTTVLGAAGGEGVPLGVPGTVGDCEGVPLGVPEEEGVPLGVRDTVGDCEGVGLAEAGVTMHESTTTPRPPAPLEPPPLPASALATRATPDAAR